MAIDFPASPTVGQEFTSGTVTYVYNGTGWLMKPQGNPYVAKAGDVMTGPLALPSSPAPVAANAVRKDYVDAAASAADAAMKVYAAPFDAMAYNGMQVNGGMDVSQQYANASIPMGYATTHQAADTWTSISVETSGGTLATQNLPPPGSPSFGSAISVCIQMKATLGFTSGDEVSEQVRFIHSIEGYRTARLRWGSSGAVPITIGFWVYTTVAGTMCVNVYNNDTNRSYIVDVVINSPATWEYKTVTIPGEQTGVWHNTTSTGISVSFVFGCGSSYRKAANTWHAGTISIASSAISTNFFSTTNNVACITGVVILPGIYAPTAAQSPLIIRSFDQELVLCKRYYGKSYTHFVRPGTSTSDGLIGCTLPPNAILPAINWQTEMRAAPTVQFYSQAGTLNVWSSPGGADGPAVSSLAPTNSRGILGMNCAGSVGVFYSGHYVCDARL